MAAVERGGLYHWRKYLPSRLPAAVCAPLVSLAKPDDKMPSSAVAKRRISSAKPMRVRASSGTGAVHLRLCSISAPRVCINIPLGLPPAHIPADMVPIFSLPPDSCRCCHQRRYASAPVWVGTAAGDIAEDLSRHHRAEASSRHCPLHNQCFMVFLCNTTNKAKTPARREKPATDVGSCANQRVAGISGQLTEHEQRRRGEDLRGTMQDHRPPARYRVEEVRRSERDGSSAIPSAASSIFP